MLFTPSPCHKLSHLLGPPSSVTYFMDGPLAEKGCAPLFYSTTKNVARRFSIVLRPLDDMSKVSASPTIKLFWSHLRNLY